MSNPWKLQYFATFPFTKSHEYCKWKLLETYNLEAGPSLDCGKDCNLFLQGNPCYCFFRFQLYFQNTAAKLHVNLDLILKTKACLHSWAEPPLKISGISSRLQALTRDLPQPWKTPASLRFLCLLWERGVGSNSASKSPTQESFFCSCSWFAHVL